MENRPSRWSLSARVSPCSSSIARNTTSSPVCRARGGGLVAEDIVDAADVRVCHLSRQVHLALEPHDRALVVGDVRQDGLERDPLAQFEILRLVELAHAAFRKVADDAEAEGDDLASPKHGGPGRPSLDRAASGALVIWLAVAARPETGLDLAAEQALDREMRIDPRDHLVRAGRASR